MKLLVYSDGHSSSEKALNFAADLALRIDAEVAVITVRAGTNAIEPQAPYGRAVEVADRDQLPPGIQVLIDACAVLSAKGLCEPPKTIEVRELPNGHMFVCPGVGGRAISFYVCFGHIIETLNHEIDTYRYDLLVIAPPQRGPLRKLLLGDVTRNLVLDVNASILMVRDGRLDSRFVICADGSEACKRQLPLLEKFLPALRQTLELVWVQPADSDPQTLQAAEDYLQHVAKRLSACGKAVKLHRLQGDDPAERIARTADRDAVIFIGASLRHDAYRRLVGSVPLQILARTAATVLVAKGLPEGDSDYLQNPDAC